MGFPGLAFVDVDAVGRCSGEGSEVSIICPAGIVVFGAGFLLGLLSSGVNVVLVRSFFVAVPRSLLELGLFMPLPGIWLVLRICCC